MCNNQAFGSKFSGEVNHKRCANTLRSNKVGYPTKFANI